MGCLTLATTLGQYKAGFECRMTRPTKCCIALSVSDTSLAQGSVLDWHSITVPQDPATLRKTTRDSVVLLLASGIDPKKSIIFQQSAVPEHVELAWILGCITSTGSILIFDSAHIFSGVLNRMTQWKAKSAQHSAPCLGLYTYPVLMAADILLYKHVASICVYVLTL